MTRHFLTMTDISSAELSRLLSLAAEIKANPAEYRNRLEGKSIAMIFAKQSTRTRISFEVGIQQLGGQPLALSTGGGTGMQMGRGETIHDTAQVLSRFVHGIVIRTFAQDDLVGLAEHGSIPVVNALTDQYHPCQALADLLTIKEKKGSLDGLKIVYAGAGNNVAHSLLLAAPMANMNVVCACPSELYPDSAVVERARTLAKDAGTTVEVETDLLKAVDGADVIYTDTWVSMGEEEEEERLLNILRPYQITSAVMGAANEGALFMHCLPAHRGDEVLNEVMDGPQSVVFDQAENRLHAQKALLALLLGGVSWE